MHKIIKHVKTGRKQQIKLQGDLSSWADIQKGGTSRLYTWPLVI